MGTKESEGRGLGGARESSFLPERQLWARVLTEVSALDGAVVEGDAEVVTRLPQLRDGDAIRAADYPGLVVILPCLSRRTEPHTDACSHTHAHAHTRTRTKHHAEEREDGGRSHTHTHGGRGRQRH